MSNKKQQMTVEMMWNEIDNLFPFKDSVEAQKFCAILDKYKEMEKEKLKEAWNKGEDCGLGRSNYEFENAEQYYNETYGGCAK